MTYWDSRLSSVVFTPGGTKYTAVELTLSSDPSIQLLLFELNNGLNLAVGPWSPKSPSTLIREIPTDINKGFVEALINPSLSEIIFSKAKQQGSALARQNKLSPETNEVFDLHVNSSESLFAQSKRKEKVERMKSMIKDLGDMTEEEVLDIWREARTEEVMSS